MKVRLSTLWLVLFALTCACGASSPAPTYGPGHPAPAARGAAEDVADGVLTFVSPPRAFDTNSYVLVGPTGLVVIDTQFLPSEAERLIRELETETGKKIALAIVLHPNPDKFNGAAVFQKHGIKVITSGQVVAQIPAVHALRKGWFYDRYKPDYPADAPLLDSFGTSTMTLQAAGLTFTLHTLGRGCSAAHVVVEWKRHLFVGDLVANGTHAWLELGFTDAWLARLKELRALGALRIHPGRGPSGGPVLIERQAQYLEGVVALVDAAHPRLPPPEGAIAGLIAQVTAAYPGYGYAVFLRVGLPAVYAARAAALSSVAPR